MAKMTSVDLKIAGLISGMDEIDVTVEGRVFTVGAKGKDLQLYLELDLVQAAELCNKLSILLETVD